MFNPNKYEMKDINTIKDDDIIEYTFFIVEASLPYFNLFIRDRRCYPIKYKLKVKDFRKVKNANEFDKVLVLKSKSLLFQDL